MLGGVGKSRPQINRDLHQGQKFIRCQAAACPHEGHPSVPASGPGPHRRLSAAAVAPLAVLAPTLDDVLRLENVKIHEAIVGYLAKAIVLRQEIENAVINDGDEALSQKPPISVADVDAFLTGRATEAASTEEAAKDAQASKLWSFDRHFTTMRVGIWR